MVEDIRHGNSAMFGAEPLRELLKLLPETEEVRQTGTHKYIHKYISTYITEYIHIHIIHACVYKCIQYILYICT